MEKKSKTISTCRSHNFIKILGNLIKSIRTNKNIQQNFRIQDKYTNSIIFLYSNEQIKNEINNSIHINIQILKNFIKEMENL